MKIRRCHSRHRERSSPPAVAAGAPQEAVPVQHTTLRPRPKRRRRSRGSGNVCDQPLGSPPQSLVEAKEEMVDDDERDGDYSTTHPEEEDEAAPQPAAGIENTKVKTEEGNESEDPEHPPGLGETKVKTEEGSGSEAQAEAVRAGATHSAVAEERHKRKGDNVKHEPGEGDRPKSKQKFSIEQKRAWEEFETLAQLQKDKKALPALVKSSDDEAPADDQPPQKKDNEKGPRVISHMNQPRLRRILPHTAMGRQGIRRQMPEKITHRNAVRDRLCLRKKDERIRRLILQL